MNKTCVLMSRSSCWPFIWKIYKDTITANGLVPVRMPLAIRAVRGHVTIILYPRSLMMMIIIIFLDAAEGSIGTCFARRPQ